MITFHSRSGEMFGLQKPLPYYNYTQSLACPPVSHDSSVRMWPRGAQEEDARKLTHAKPVVLAAAIHCSVVDHGCFKASWTTVRRWTTSLAAGAFGWDSHSVGSRGGLPLESQQDEGKPRKREWRAENTGRQRQSRAGPRRRSSSRSRGEHGNLIVWPVFYIQH